MRGKEGARALKASVSGALRALLALGGLAAGAVAYGVMDYIYDPEFFRAGKKPAPSTQAAPGEVFLEPSTVRAGEGWKTLLLRYRCGPGGISEDGGLKISLCRVVDFGDKGRRVTFAMAHGWGAWQNRYPRLRNYYRCELSTEGKARLEVVPQGYFPWRGALRFLGREVLRRAGVKLDPLDLPYLFMEQRKIRLRVRGDRLQEGDEIRVVLGDTSLGSKGWRSPCRAVTVEVAVEVDEKATGVYRLVESPPVLETIGGEAACFEAVLDSGVMAGEGHLLVKAVDEKGQLDRLFVGEVEMEATPGLEIPPRTAFSPVDRGCLRLPCRVVKEGVHRVKVRSPGGEGESNRVPFPGPSLRLFWGDIHVHTVLCDGMLEPGEYYRRARDEEGLDFAAVTLHDTMARLLPSGLEYEWELIKDLAERYNEPGRFAVFVGYEWSDHGQGHRGVIYAPWEKDPRLFGFPDPGSSTAGGLEERLEGYHALVIPHHTAWRRIFLLPWNWAKFIHMKIPGPYTWWGPDSEKQRLVEIYSDHGSSECYHSSHPIAHGKAGALMPRFLWDDRCRPGMGNYVQEALARGLRLGIIAGSDRHDHAADERVHPMSIYPGGLTAVWAEELTAESLWRSLWNRRAYGTTGARIHLEFYADDAPMGSEYFTRDRPRLHGRIIAAAPVKRAELLRHDGNGYGTAWSRSGGEEISFDLVDREAEGEAFYYLRVEQVDGHCAWSSPIWILGG